MKKLYEKNELTFALLWIVVYCVLQSLANPFNKVVGVEYSASAAFCILQAVILFAFIRKNHLQKRYGLCKSSVSASRFLYYVPLFILASGNLWNGVALNYSLLETICRIVCMLCVGFLEEVIFRGLLFTAIARDNIKSAIVISSVTFGIGHIINLFNGSGMELVNNLCQIVFAIAVGFLLVTIFYHGGSLLPCILVHSAINTLGTFANDTGLTMEMRLLHFGVLIAITVAYNPMAYIHSEKDILKLVTALMTNTKGEGQGGDPFWDKAERLLLVSLIAYLHYEAPVEEQNFATLLEMLNTMQVSEDDETYQNPVDLLFEDLGKKKPNSFAVRQYKLYKLAAGKTARSILISCGARMAPFDIQEVRDATMYDELELDKLGDRKTALFLIMSDTDSTFNFLISMIYTQLFNLLCDKADDVYSGKLPVHVRCLIDECANIGQIPQLEKLVATIRSREISACLVLQTRSQLKAIYKDNADTIVGNMDRQIFLGGSEPTTLKELSEALGKETIDSYNNSDTRGNSPSYGTNYQKLSHELMSRDELAVLDGGKCILQLRGVRPFLSDKYDLTQHPNYKYTSDYDPKNALDIEKFLNRKEKIHPDDTFIMVDADSLPPA